MRKSYVALLLLIGAVAFTAGFAFAQEEDNGSIVGSKLMNARMSHDLLSRAAKLGVSSTPSPNDTVCVGFNEAFAGSNYWSIGKGRPRLPYNRQGIWAWEDPVHGDSLQGWWPRRLTHTNASGALRADVNRPWWSIEAGNNASYVINQGAGLKRTFGVVGVWHSDPGSLDGSGGTSMVAWTPCGGTGKSAWMGLRAHGDLASGLDPLTGNPWNAGVLITNGTNGGTSATAGNIGSSRNFPGYGSQMDQMLYKDIDVTGMPADSGLMICWQYQTAMSPGRETVANFVAGWFEGDPLRGTTLLDKDPINPYPVGSDGNFISGSTAAGVPLDSFQVYVGAPAETTIAGVDNFLASTGVYTPIYDPLRRWFNEVLWKGRRKWCSGDSGSTHFASPGVWQTKWCYLSAAEKVSCSRNGKVRLVFRVHTNRGFDDEGTAYTSNGLGAAQVDNVTIGLTPDPVDATTVIGDFEGTDPLLDIDNTNPWAWHSTGKPPAIYFHTHDLASLLAAQNYDDLCGPPGGEFRICDMDGIVISSGDHDNGEAAGSPVGPPTPPTTERNGNWGMMSPTINLVAASKTPNNMGITGEEAVATEDYYIAYEIYTGIFDIFTQGNGWQFGFMSYPALQRNGKSVWGELRLPGFLYFNPDRQCFKNLDAANANGLIVTSGVNAPIPDSLRIHLHKIQQCYRFGVVAGCSPVDGAYFDHVGLYIIDGKPQPLSVDIWQWFNDTFPCNELIAPGTVAFDTTAAVIRTGLNVAQTTGDCERYDVPGDSVAIVADGECIRIDLVFRVLPGPGNYSTIGTPSSGLRYVPTAATPVIPSGGGDGSWFGGYMATPGTYASPGAAAQHALADGEWDPLVWNSAQCDTAQFNLFPVSGRGINTGVTVGVWQSTYHEDDPHFGVWTGAGDDGQCNPIPKCFMIDPVAPAPATDPNITCSAVPAWVTAGAPGNGYDGSPTTCEGNSIFEDGIFTPGTHVEYFFRREDLSCMPTVGQVSLCPDTTVVSPQPLESSTDGHRWQEFSVLPDRWKDTNFTGRTPACMLYVDWNDRRGNELVWVGVADSIGATSVADRGNHNGWSAAGAGADINLPAYRQYKNKQAGTTWDMYGVKASESLTTSAAQLGSRDSHHAASLVDGKWSWQGPTLDMLLAYYSIVMILSGDLNSGILGSFDDRSQNDINFLENYLLASGTIAHPGTLGLWCGGDGFAESEWGHDAACDFSGVNSLLESYMGVSLYAPNYKNVSQNLKQVADLKYYGTTYGVGDIYGVRNQCTYTLDVLDISFSSGDGELSAADYEFTAGGPWVASAYHPVTFLNQPWITVLDGFNIFNLRSRFGIGSYGRLAYMYNSFCNWFGSICTITGVPTVTLDTPGTGNGELFVNFMNLRNNPLRSGVATVNFGLAKSDRVEIKVYDVTGRLVRTLADRVFVAGNHMLTWDGVNDHGQKLSRGVYFTQVKYQNSRFVEAKKLTLLK
jgi:hypothetical protein